MYYWHQAAELWLKETSHKRDHPKDQQKIQWLSPLLDHYKLTQIDRQLIREIASRKKEQSSSSTANRYLALIRSILRRARNEWEWIEEVPYIRLFQEPRNRTRWLNKTEASRLIDALPYHLSTMAQFSLMTGLRQSNVTNLQWKQVDWARSVIEFEADEMKSGRPFSCPLNDTAKKLLLSQKNQNIGSQTYVFTYKNRPIKNPNNTAWKRTLKSLNIERFRWHDLRHTWASWHVQNGTTLQELMRLGDWSNYQMVLRYAHLSFDGLLSVSSNIEL